MSVGSFPEYVDNNPDKGYNLQLLISPDGDIKYLYRKIHLFDSPYSGLEESKTTSTIIFFITNFLVLLI